MKKSFLSIALVLFVSVVFAQATKVKVTTKTTVEFPAAPEKKEQGAVTTFNYIPKDSAFVYTVAIMDLEATNGLTAEMLAVAAADPSFWDQAEGGFMGSMGADAKKLKREIRKVGESEGMYIELERPENGKKILVTAMIMIEGKYTVSLVHIDKTGADTVNRDKFFSSVEMVK